MFEATELFADRAKNLIDSSVLALLLQLADECRISERRGAMPAGKRISVAEGRPVLHTALRASRGTARFCDGLHDVLDRMLTFAEPKPLSSALSSPQIRCS